MGLVAMAPKHESFEDYEGTSSASRVPTRLRHHPAHSTLIGDVVHNFVDGILAAGNHCRNAESGAGWPAARQNCLAHGVGQGDSFGGALMGEVALSFCRGYQAS